MASKDHGLTPIELSSFCSEIALMLGAGMPLYAGKEALEKTYEDDAHAALYRGVSETLTQTGSLRDALESAHVFPTYLVEMCGVGERTGHLEDVMQGLSVYYERESRIRQAVRSAVTYPLVLAVMMIIAVLAVLVSWLLRSAAKGDVAKSKLFLHQKEELREQQDMQVLVGHEGRTLSVLRPSGIGDFDGVRLNVVTEGEFIENGVAIRIARVEGGKIVVKAIKS